MMRSKGLASAKGATTRLLATVARSSSRVRKLCTGSPEAARLRRARAQRRALPGRGKRPRYRVEERGLERRDKCAGLEGRASANRHHLRPSGAHRGECAGQRYALFLRAPADARREDGRVGEAYLLNVAVRDERRLAAAARCYARRQG